MGTNSSKLDDLFELREVLSKGLGGKIAVIICDGRFGHDAMISADLFVLLLGLKSLMVHVLGVHLVLGLEQSAFGGINKMVYRHSLTWKKVTGLKHISFVFDFCLVQSRCRAQGLFAILIGCTPEYIKELTGCSVKASGFCCVGKYTRPKEELHFLHHTMTKLVVPLQQSFWKMNLRDSGVEC